MRLAVPLALCAALALTACGSREEAEPAPQTETPQAYETQAAVETGNAQAFIDRIASAELFNVEAGKAAIELGSSPEVKTYAELMGHNRANSTDALREAVAQGADGLTVTPALSTEQQARLERLRNSGGNFDQVYAMQQAEALRQTLDTLRAYAVGGDDPALRKYASATALKVERHLETAKELR